MPAYAFDKLKWCVVILQMLALSYQLLFALSGMVSGAHALRSETESCKAYPGTSSWPSASTWAALNQTLDGRLLQPSPPGAVCHPDQPTYNASQCADVAEEWTTYEFHTENPVSVMWDQYDNYTCLPEMNTTCSSAGYPAYVVNASSAEHVKIGIDFARKYNIRLNIKNTGHDYMGRSNSPGSLSIWTHHLNQITYNQGQLKLSGSGRIISGDSYTVGGGAQMYNVYSAADKHHQTIVGGGAKSVGIGGYITGGGHSVLAPSHGLAADNVWEMEIVTPGGDILTVNEDQSPDLFWAMRGGGGSTFGVITSATLKAYPSPKVTGVTLVIVTDTKESFVPDLLAYIASQMPSLMEQGVSGYNIMTKDMQNPIQEPGLPDRIAGLVGSCIMQDIDGSQVITEAFNPINETIQQRWPNKVQFYTIIEQFDSFLGWFDKNYDMYSAGGSAYLVSRLLDGEALTGDSEALGNALQEVLSSGSKGSLAAYMVAGKGVQEAVPRGGGNAVNPAWRTAYVHALNGETFAPLNSTDEDRAKAVLEKNFQPLRDLTPGGGAYINEARLSVRKRLSTNLLGQQLRKVTANQAPSRPNRCFLVLAMCGQREMGGPSRWTTLSEMMRIYGPGIRPVIACYI
ncbi:FAD binding domain-containing protein [Trichoderma gamsii]|uniref:FAD binding domain-containing protein n=1 Tax=Trichoderma gamsii TaxID=398673 RepID=A0A2P4ZXQ8_9HYPO|nr:FAD binding domain-containing protein [Trichoderma gamsii]PON29066.1 FAD binding domain-containing protein [Trichoderma gamsii]